MTSGYFLPACRSEGHDSRSCHNYSIKQESCVAQNLLEVEQVIMAKRHSSRKKRNLKILFYLNFMDSDKNIYSVGSLSHSTDVQTD